MSPFLRACSYGSLETIKLLLQPDILHEEKVSSQFFDSAENGNTGLHCACQHGHYEVVRYLVNLISSFPSTEIFKIINSQNQYKLTPLHYACAG